MSRLIAILTLLTAGAVAACGANSASAADWPTRQVQLVVPYPPGGSADLVARDAADFLSKKLGQTVLVINRPGASGTIGANSVAKAQPDGYTLLLVQAGPITAALTNKKLPYDPIRDFKYIALFGRAPVLLSVAASSPYKSVADIVKAAKEKSGTLAYAGPGIGTPGHLAAELFQAATGTKLVYVPYNGSGQIIADMLGGQVAMSFDAVSAHISLVNGGTTRGLAIASNARSTAIPGVPTGSEQGLGGWEGYTYFGIAAPAGIDNGVVTRLNAAINEFVQQPASAKRMDELGVLPNRVSTPQDAEAFVRAELTRIEPVVKSANITTE